MSKNASMLKEIANNSKSWPFIEAKKIISRLNKNDKSEVIFETGYGPSGLPHIGTFGEVARTSMVRHAFHTLTEGKIPSRLICFSDDMDGLRKVPTNVPNQDMLAKHIDKPLSKVPDPFSNQYPSFADHNNARLCNFLDKFDFDYEFISATKYYKSGKFDKTLLLMLENYKNILKIILPTLGKDRQKTYSPFLPICPRTGKVLQVPMQEYNIDNGTVTYIDQEINEEITIPVTGGSCKMQWKADWAMRWIALGVDYEMAGKDLIDSVNLSGKIVKTIGKPPPEGFNYELFLDKNGEKISKSKGNGLTIDEWLTYANPESLSLFMYQKPKTAKRLYFDIIPKNVDEYLTFLNKYKEQEEIERVENPVWHIHNGSPTFKEDIPISFNLLLNLVNAANAEDKQVLWGFISRYKPEITPETSTKLDELVNYAISYFNDFVKPNKKFRSPNNQEREALQDLSIELAKIAKESTAEEIQNLIYTIGKSHNFEKLRDWFTTLYEVLLGQSQGPRFGSFVALYGIKETIALINKALNKTK